MLSLHGPEPVQTCRQRHGNNGTGTLTEFASRSGREPVEAGVDLSQPGPGYPWVDARFVDPRGGGIPSYVMARPGTEPSGSRPVHWWLITDRLATRSVRRAEMAVEYPGLVESPDARG
jgi:hypothetical protein